LKGIYAVMACHTYSTYW